MAVGGSRTRIRGTSPIVGEAHAVADPPGVVGFDATVALGDAGRAGRPDASVGPGGGLPHEPMATAKPISKVRASTDDRRVTADRPSDCHPAGDGHQAVSTPAMRAPLPASTKMAM